MFISNIFFDQLKFLIFAWLGLNPDSDYALLYVVNLGWNDHFEIEELFFVNYSLFTA